MQGMKQVISIGIVNILVDAKVFDILTAEHDKVHHMGQEPSSMGDRDIAVRGQVFHQACVGNNASLQ